MGEIMKMLGAVTVLGAIPGLILLGAAVKGDDPNARIARAKEERAKQEQKAKQCAPFNVIYKELIDNRALIDREGDRDVDIYMQPYYWMPLNVDSRETIAKNLYYCQSKMRILDYSSGKLMAERGFFSGWKFY